MQSANNFPFRNTSRFGTPTERQANAGFIQTGLLQDIVYQASPKSRLALYAWYHDNLRDIQPTMSVRQNDETQDDRNLRIVGSTPASRGTV